MRKTCGSCVPVGSRGSRGRFRLTDPVGDFAVVLSPLRKGALDAAGGRSVRQPDDPVVSCQWYFEVPPESSSHLKVLQDEC